MAVHDPENQQPFRVAPTDNLNRSTYIDDVRVLRRDTQGVWPRQGSGYFVCRNRAAANGRIGEER
jgi:hypothetical protein